MLKAGGEAKRRELISQFEDLSISNDKLAMTQEEKKISAEGEEGQGEYITGAKLNRGKR